MSQPAMAGSVRVDRGVTSGTFSLDGETFATGRSFSDRRTLEASIRERLFALPDATRVHPGHGDDTTIGAERALLGE